MIREPGSLPSYGRTDTESGTFFIVLDMSRYRRHIDLGENRRKAPRNKPEPCQLPSTILSKIYCHRYSRRADMDINDLCSDDLGFLLQGLTALQISLLPWKEAREWKKSAEAAHKGEDKTVVSIKNLKKPLLVPPCQLAGQSYRNGQGKHVGSQIIQDNGVLFKGSV